MTRCYLDSLLTATRTACHFTRGRYLLRRQVHNHHRRGSQNQILQLTAITMILWAVPTCFGAKCDPEMATKMRHTDVQTDGQKLEMNLSQEYIYLFQICTPPLDPRSSIALSLSLSHRVCVCVREKEIAVRCRWNWAGKPQKSWIHFPLPPNCGSTATATCWAFSSKLALPLWTDILVHNLHCMTTMKTTTIGQKVNVEVHSNIKKCDLCCVNKGCHIQRIKCYKPLSKYVI